MKYEIISEVAIELKEDIKISYMGGALVAVCNKCKKHLAADDCPFPGTKEQTEPIKAELYSKASDHNCEQLT